MLECEDVSTQTLPRRLQQLIQAATKRLQQWQEGLNQALASRPMAMMALSCTMGVVFWMLMYGSDLLSMVGVIGWVLSGPPLIITLLFVPSGLEEAERHHQKQTAAKTPCPLESLPESFCLHFMDGTGGSFKILFPDVFRVRVIVFYHTVDSSANVLQEPQLWDQLAGEEECCGKIVLCNTESAEKAIAVSAKIGVHKALHVHALRPRGLPCANPLALHLDQSGWALECHTLILFS